LNIHIADPTSSKLTSMHFYAWKKGLKTGMYYLRTRPKADAIQFTVDQQQLTADKAKASAALFPARASVAAKAAPQGINGLDTEDDEDQCLNCGA